MSWKDKINKVNQQDCLDLMKEMPDKCVDLVVTDPPYGVTQNKWDKIVEFSEMWQGLEKVTKNNGAIVITATQPFATDLISSNRELFKYDLIWYKPLATGFLNANRMPLRNHEYILVFYKNLPTYNPQKFIGKKRRGGTNKRTGGRNYGEFESYKVEEHSDYFPQSVIEFNNADKTNIKHPTQKPVDLFKYLIKTYSNQNNLIFDPFMGSWTTARACVDLGRNFIGAELSEEYCEIGRQRLRQQVLL